MHRRPEKAGDPPSIFDFKPCGDRPANCAGKSGNQRDAGDRASGVTFENDGQAGKGGFIKSRGHADPNDQPRKTYSNNTIRQPKQGKAYGKHKA